MMYSVFTAMQSSGIMHLGNLLGAVKPLINMQNSGENKILCSIADMHSITVWQDPKELKKNTISFAACLIAAGVDPNKTTLFVQSQVQEHAELAWILGCTARTGWLNRMTQFKDKSNNNKETVSAGLYFYPVLMAADVLLYQTDLVPVGEDQKQHIEFIRDVAIKFNKDYNVEFFKIPESVIIKGARVMSLKDGSKKMSKSDPSENSKILITDSDDQIRSKIMKAKTDSFDIKGQIDDIKLRSELYNLLNIYAFVNNITIEKSLEKFINTKFSDLKSNLAEDLVKLINPIRIEYNELLKDKTYLEKLLKESACKARDIASKTLNNVKNIVGFLS